MAIKTYFDVTWQGPVLDANSKPTKEVKGERIPCPLAGLDSLAPLTQSSYASVVLETH